MMGGPRGGGMRGGNRGGNRGGMRGGMNGGAMGAGMMGGGSMGGYQAAFTAGLATLLKKHSKDFKITYVGASVPAFCNIAGQLDNRIRTGLTVYNDGMDYFDTAMAAHLIDSPIEVQRAAMGDESCPATHITAFFNSIPNTTVKKIKYLQNSSHGYIPDEYIQHWIIYRYNIPEGEDISGFVF